MASPNSSHFRVFSSDCHSRTPLGLSIPVCYLRSPIGQKGLIGLLLQPDSIPVTQCPPPPPRHRMKLPRRWALKVLLTGDSARCSQQTFTICLGLSGLTGLFPRHQSQLTTSWWLFESSAPLFTRVSRTCGHKSNDANTKSIIELWPRVFWCSFMPEHGVCYGQYMTSTEVQQQNSLGFRSGGPLFPTTPPPGLTVAALTLLGIEITQEDEGISRRGIL